MFACCKKKHKTHVKISYWASNGAIGGLLGQRYFYTDSASKDSETIVKDAHPDLEKRDLSKLCFIVEKTLKFMLWQSLGLNGPRFETIQWERIGVLLNNGKEVVMYPALTSHLKGPSPRVHVKERVEELE